MEIEIPLIKLEDANFQVAVDLNLYNKEAITAAVYKFTDSYYVHQSVDTENSSIVNVIFESKDGDQVADSVPKLFCNELIDQQLRYNVNAQFGHIRDLIVEQAFKPIN